ncbi:MAG TPA: pilus assembly protein TadG-related protein [Chloroflexota bacterium]|nr:pilus assembly protein TadG-related protein [Chloroflexota bacterium]
MKRFFRSEDGMVAVLVALCMTMLLGFTGLVLDAGVLFVQRTQMQKAVDAASLAGAQDIGFSGTNPSADAANIAAANGVTSAELTYNGYDSTFAGNDSWRVTASRTVPLIFAPLVGFNNGTISVESLAISSALKSIDAQYVLPYALWSGNPSGEYSAGGLQPGTVPLYRDNQWPSSVVVPDPNKCKPLDSKDNNDNRPLCNPNWNVGPNVDFKGFFNNLQGELAVGGSIPPSSQGGNSSEPTDLLCQLAASGHEALIPVVSAATQASGGISFTISGFMAVTVNTISVCNGGKDMSQPFYATIIGPADFTHGTPGGTTTTTNPVRVLKIWR